MFDEVVPGIGLIARFLGGRGICEDCLVLDPPDRAFAEAMDGFGPELVAVAGECRDVDGPCCDPRCSSG